MKKFFTIAAIMASSIIFAQDNNSDKKNNKITTISARGMYSEPSQFGLSFEFEGLKWGYKNTQIVNISYGVMNYDVGLFDVDGQGFAIEIGGRKYYNKGTKLEGLYTGNYLSYGNIKFDEDLMFGKFDGTYSYFSFFSPEVGFKMTFGDFSIDPFIGIMWKIEVKGKGDIDNKYVDEWTPRGGLKIGYTF
ncbi:hypothetical protein [Flavobacterium beibuense]|uniref:DUF3575 domain-containing protein n=1 Tax=Flavobacterium beibuense F44-8 TaxID=1406840 RepID=A0A0A2LR80_9FLAO|nr:hypothetical protein [Flavobacterium beibuense]KGO78700.1 hypothetical protein Q763_17070 [Flavobacterium beibuense F44-8]